MDFQIVKNPIETEDRAPTAASLMPCQNGWLDDWSFDSCDSSGACRISQKNETCLGAYGCDDSQLRMFDCHDATTPLRCQLFKLSSTGALIHEASKLCVEAVVQLSAESDMRVGENEQVARLLPCDTKGQQWKHSAGQLISPGGSCLSTKARHASIAPVYASVCARFYYNWFSQATAQRALCIEAYTNGSWVLRGAPGLQIGKQDPSGSRGAALHGAFVLAHGALPTGAFPAGEWHSLLLNLSGVSLSGAFDGHSLFSKLQTDAMSTNGPVALGGSYNEMLFDNLEISELPPPTLAPGSVLGEVLASPFGVPCGVFQPVGAVKGTSGFRYDVGMVINCTAPGVTVHKLGRWKTAGSSNIHTLTVLDITGLTLPAQSNQTKLVASTSVDLAGAHGDIRGQSRAAASRGDAGVSTAATAGDELGFWYGSLSTPLQLEVGHQYAVLSSENSSASADAAVAKVAATKSDAATGVEILGAATLVNGSLVTDLATASCSNTAGAACKSSNPLQTSCSSSDWLAPSVPAGWNFQTQCCADYTAKCLHEQWTGPTINGPVNALLA